MPEVHIHLYGARTVDSGTSEGAKKAAQTRKAHAGYNPAKGASYDPKKHEKAGFSFYFKAPKGTSRGTSAYWAHSEAEAHKQMKAHYPNEEVVRSHHIPPKKLK